MRQLPLCRSAVALAAALLAASCTDPNSTPVEQDCGSNVCGDGQRCVAGACLDTCASKAECRPNQDCLEGVCRTKVSSSSSAAAVSSSSAGGASSLASSSSALASSSAAAVSSSSAGAGSSSSVAPASSSSASSSSSGGGSSSTQGGAALGAACVGDGDCASQMCRPVFGGVDTKVCVTPCARQLDCGPSGSLFCNPASPGADGGVCVPASPSHCRTCASDAECGRSSERCVQPDGEDTPVCLIDCSIAGAAACPSDYSCAAVDVGGQTRQLCRPSAGTCILAKGGSCERVTADQPCADVSDAGRCTGLRTCGADQRYTACNAATPACRTSCDQPNPAGCTVSACPGAATTPTNCGECGHACPGADQPSTVVACDTTTCSFACNGERYDVNALQPDGCEITDSPTGNHTQGTSHVVGAYSCNDNGSAQNLAGFFPSDTRSHVPAVDGLDPVTGTAPDFLTLNATGGIACVNDINFTLTVTHTSVPTCFKLTVTTDKLSESCTTAADGTCNVSHGSGSYTGDTDVVVEVVKSCSSAVPENASYHVTGHL